VVPISSVLHSNSTQKAIAIIFFIIFLFSFV